MRVCLRPMLIMCFALTAAASAWSQSNPPAPTVNAPKRGPARTVQLGEVFFYYYETPEASAATTTFYLSGSKSKSMTFDYVAMNAIFVNTGAKLTTPDFVRLIIFAGTYRDGCKYQDRYANKINGHLALNIVADQQTVVSQNLPLTQTASMETRKGKLCTEWYDFQLSYDQFVRLSMAKEAQLSLGTRQFEIKDPHRAALRTMSSGIGRF